MSKYIVSFCIAIYVTSYVEKHYQWNFLRYFADVQLYVYTNIRWIILWMVVVSFFTVLVEKIAYKFRGYF